MKNKLLVAGILASSLLIVVVLATLAKVVAAPPVNPLRKAKEPSAIAPAAATSPEKNTRRATLAKTEDATQPATGAQPAAKIKFDPVAVNGRYFEGWPKPKLAIVITGRQDGYLEPCGCAGLENQKGGLGRRASFFDQLRRQGWDLLPIDVGGQVHRFGRQSEIKFAIAAEALKQLDYKAVGFGTDDLRLSAGEIAAAVAGDADGSIFLSANVELLGLGDLTPRYRVIEAGGRKIGITAVFGNQYQKEINNPEVELKPAPEAIAEVLPKLAGCNLKILLAYATEQETEILARKFPEFNLVVTADSGDEPPANFKKIEGSKARLVECGVKGGYAIVIGLYDDKTTPLRYQRVALDSRFATAPEMKQLMESYQSQLQALGWQELGLRPMPHPRGQGHDKLWGEFAGVNTCEKCHPTAYKIWKNSKHAHATESLVKADPPRQFDPECVSCHVTGWNPEGFFPYATGFTSLSETPKLAGNTCENCHGPSAAHVAAENGKSNTKRQEQRELLRLQQGTAEQTVCLKCHDHDNSPDFKFETYWPKVEHKGKK